MTHPVRTIVFVATAALGLGACSTYDDRYYGSGYYGGGYYERGNATRAYPAYYGWYNDFYYPGVGHYVYSRGGDRYRWNDATRRYWEARRAHYRDRREWREDWSGYRGEWRDDRREWRRDRREWRRDRRDNRRDWRRRD